MFFLLVLVLWCVNPRFSVLLDSLWTMKILLQLDGPSGIGDLDPAANLDPCWGKFDNMSDLVLIENTGEVYIYIYIYIYIYMCVFIVFSI